MFILIHHSRVLKNITFDKANLPGKKHKLNSASFSIKHLLLESLSGILFISANHQNARDHEQRQEQPRILQAIFRKRNRIQNK